MLSLLLEQVLDEDTPGDVPLSQAERKALLEKLRRGERAIEWSETHPEALDAERREFYSTLRWTAVDHLRRGWRDPGAARIAQELWKRRKTLFTFVVEPGVDWHNNEAETQIRQGVLDRKISGGRRSWSGAWALERLLSIYRTCRRRNLQFVSVLKEALSGFGYPQFGAPSNRPQT
jgi:transposase